MSTPILGAGITFGYSDVPASGVPSTPTPLAKVNDFSGGEETVGKVKTTNHDSPNKKHEYIPGWTEVSDLTVDLMYNKADAVTLRGFIANKTVKAWSITFPDGPNGTPGSRMWVAGFLTQLGHTSPLEAAMASKVQVASTDSTLNFIPASGV